MKYSNKGDLNVFRTEIPLLTKEIHIHENSFHVKTLGKRSSPSELYKLKNSSVFFKGNGLYDANSKYEI